MTPPTITIEARARFEAERIEADRLDREEPIESPYVGPPPWLEAYRTAVATEEAAEAQAGQLPLFAEAV